MRIWHISLLKFLPKPQMVSAWRELNSIFSRQNKHLFINYVYKYPKIYLYAYSMAVIAEMRKRRYQLRKWENFEKYFADIMDSNLIHEDLSYFRFDEHDDVCLIENFYNLQEKFYSGQKGFSKQEYIKLRNYIENRGFKIYERPIYSNGLDKGE